MKKIIAIASLILLFALPINAQSPDVIEQNDWGEVCNNTNYPLSLNFYPGIQDGYTGNDFWLNNGCSWSLSSLSAVAIPTVNTPRFDFSSQGAHTIRFSFWGQADFVIPASYNQYHVSVGLFTRDIAGTETTIWYKMKLTEEKAFFYVDAPAFSPRIRSARIFIYFPPSPYDPLDTIPANFYFDRISILGLLPAPTPTPAISPTATNTPLPEICNRYDFEYSAFQFSEVAHPGGSWISPYWEGDYYGSWPSYYGVVNAESPIMTTQIQSATVKFYGQFDTNVGLNLSQFSLSRYNGSFWAGLSINDPVTRDYYPLVATDTQKLRFYALAGPKDSAPTTRIEWIEICGGYLDPPAPTPTPTLTPTATITPTATRTPTPSSNCAIGWPLQPSSITNTTSISISALSSMGSYSMTLMFDKNMNTSWVSSSNPSWVYAWSPNNSLEICGLLAAGSLSSNGYNNRITSISGNGFDIGLSPIIFPPNSSVILPISYNNCYNSTQIFLARDSSNPFFNELSFCVRELATATPTPTPGGPSPTWTATPRINPPPDNATWTPTLDPWIEPPWPATSTPTPGGPTNTPSPTPTPSPTIPVPPGPIATPTPYSCVYTNTFECDFNYDFSNTSTECYWLIPYLGYPVNFAGIQICFQWYSMRLVAFGYLIPVWLLIAASGVLIFYRIFIKTAG
jgi:hypothetical protein